jgi:hypothetical protein
VRAVLVRRGGTRVNFKLDPSLIDESRIKVRLRNENAGATLFGDAAEEEVVDAMRSTEASELPLYREVA